jgi:glycerophosphoryl diester phosphodiesterase
MLSRTPTDRRSFLRRGALGLVALGVGSFPFDIGVSKAEGPPPPRQTKMLKAGELISRVSPLIIAHRGLPTVAPENSLPGFEAASTLFPRPDFVELDYRHSADGIPTVIHDDKLDRTTNSRVVFGAAEVLIGTKTFVELQKLDAGSWFDPKFTGTKLASLSEAIDLVCPKTCLMIERKDGDAATLVKLLREKQVLDLVIVQAFDWDFIAEVGKLVPDLPTGLLGKKELDAEKLAKIRAIGPRVIGWDYRDLDAAAIRAGHNAGVKVWSYTINDPAKARELVAAGLNGVITNHADKAGEWLAAK